MVPLNLDRWICSFLVDVFAHFRSMFLLIFDRWRQFDSIWKEKRV